MKDSKVEPAVRSDVEQAKPKLDVSYGSSEGVAVIRMVGDLLGSEVVQFRRACTVADREGLQDRIVDLSDVQRIDGYGLAGLVGLLSRRKSQGGRVILCGINPDLRVKFESTHCDVIFDTAFTVAKALEMLKEGKKL